MVAVERINAFLADGGGWSEQIRTPGQIINIRHAAASGQVESTEDPITIFAGGWIKAGAGKVFGMVGGVAAKGVSNTVTKSESVLGHIFRDAAGHVNPSTVASQNRYISLFENVANNPANLNQSILSPRAIENGVQGFTQSFKNGQIWVQTKNGKIFNAGVNIIKK